MMYHFPRENEDHLVQEEDTLGDDDPEFAQKEVESVFRTLNRGKAPGMDGLPFEIAELLFKTNKKLFVVLLNKCLSDGVFLSSWKVADLVLFNKVGKDRGLPSS